MADNNFLEIFRAVISRLSDGIQQFDTISHLQTLIKIVYNMQINLNLVFFC